MKNLIIGFVTSIFITLLCCACVQKSTDTAVLLPIELEYQHKDTALTCNVHPLHPIAGAHPWNHAKESDGIYGTADDCPRCSTYCAPASIAMIVKAYGIIGIYCEQDYIYDAGKSTSPDVPKDGNLDTCGAGMFHGVGGFDNEVQNAFLWALTGIPHDDHDGAFMQADILILKNTIIQERRPILWLDHGGWPDDQYDELPADRQYQGHAKVIGGYDDRGTEDFSDDLCLILDPWPQYNEEGFSPQNATKGPGDTNDPYWLPLSMTVTGDSNDRFLIPTQPIPE